MTLSLALILLVGRGPDPILPESEDVVGDGKGARCAVAVNTAMGSASVESLQRAVGRETSSSPLILVIHSTTAQLASLTGASPCAGCWVSRDGEGMISDHLELTP